MKHIDVKFFPGWTRKAITFSIDDGKVEWDRKFLDIVRPHGILGTFNLNDTNRASAEEYRALYHGYEIANHCKHHPLIFREDIEYKFSDEPFDKMESSVEYVYKTDVPHVYMMHYSLYLEDKTKYPKPGGWHWITDKEHYIEFLDEAKADLEKVFGKDSVRGFAWPYGKQSCESVVAYLKKEYYHARKSGITLDKMGFALPPDRLGWRLNARYSNLLEVAELYEKYPDDGELKLFSFGAHSIDYETGNHWGDLETFAKTYGDRPNDYYYAAVGDIFAYADAVRSVEITDTEIKNPTDTTLYLKIEGESVVLGPHETIAL